MEQKKIEFKKTRDFGQKFNATFEFIRQEFRPLMTGLLYIAGPVIAITSIITAYFQRWSLSLMDFSFEDPEMFFSDDLWTSAISLLIFSVASYIFIFAVINEYVKEYIKGGKQPVEIGPLWDAVRNNLSNYAISIIGYVFIMIAFILAIIFSMAFFISMNSVLLTIAVSTGVMILVFMTICVFYLLPIVYNTESESLFSSIGRTVELIKGKWLSTLGLLIVASLVASIASFIFAIPNYALSAAGFVHSLQDPENMDLSFTQSLSYGITTFIATAGQYLLSIIPVLAIIFQYYNLVERRDASGLMERIDQLGTEKGKDEDESF